MLYSNHMLIKKNATHKTQYQQSKILHRMNKKKSIYFRCQRKKLFVIVATYIDLNHILSKSKRVKQMHTNEN